MLLASKKLSRIFAAQIILIMIFGFLGFSTTTFAKAEDKEPVTNSNSSRKTVVYGDELTIEAAIAKAEASNPTLVAQKYTLENAEITFKAAWDRMYIPRVTLTSTAQSRHTMFQVPGSPAFDSGAAGHNWEHGSPTSGVALNIGEYTLFNFGRDRDTFQIAQLTVERAREQLVEAKRTVRFDVINKVYNLKTKQDLYDVAQRSVESAQVIYELIESRIPLKKAESTDLSSAEVDLLNAKNSLKAAETEYEQALWAVNQVLWDPIDYHYVVREKIRKTRFKASLEALLKTFEASAPAVKDALLAQKSAEIQRKIVQKNMLPMPTITFSGVTLGYNFNPNQSVKVRDTTSAGTSGNFDVSAALTLTVPLTGDGGLFNRDTLRAAAISEEQANLSLVSAKRSTEVSLRGLLAQLQQQESAIENNERIYEQASAVLEASIRVLQQNKTFNRVELKTAIEQTRTAEQDLTNAILQQFNVNQQIALLLGIDGIEEEQK